MAKNDLYKRTDPHEFPWYWKLLGMHKLLSHPISVDNMEGEDDSMAGPGMVDWLDNRLKLASERKEKYRIFDEMDHFGLVTGILDVYAEEVTQVDYDRGQTVWLESSAQHMITAGEECLRNIMIEDQITDLARRTCKNGDAFQRLLYQVGKGVLGWKHAEAAKMHRREDKFGRLIGFSEDGKKFRGTLNRADSWPWDYAHFRLLGKDSHTGYGTSILEAMFRPWRQMALAEDAMLLYRLRRMPDRHLILVDVGDLEEHEAMRVANAWRKKLRKDEIIDPASPNYQKQYNPLTPMEDVVLPVRGTDTATRIESLSGSSSADQIVDLEHFRDVFFGAAKAPKAYFGFEGDINAKATLMQQDVRFSRTCKRVRRTMMYGIRNVLDIHFTLLESATNTNKYDPRVAGNQYVVQLPPISYLDEWERLQLIELRFRIVESMSRLAMDMGLDQRVWSIYVLRNYAKLPEELVLKLVSRDEESGPAGPGGIAAGMEHAAHAHGMTLDQYRTTMQPLSESKGYMVSKKEARMIAEAVHNSPELRKVLGQFAEWGEEESEEALLRRAVSQVDPAMQLPISLGEEITDDYDDDPRAKQLQEDMGTLDAPAEPDDDDETEV